MANTKIFDVRLRTDSSITISDVDETRITMEAGHYSVRPTTDIIGHRCKWILAKYDDTWTNIIAPHIATVYASVDAEGVLINS